MGRGDRKSVRWVKDRAKKKKEADKRHELARAEERKQAKRKR